MVASATNLTRSGLRDWIIQRVSAVILGFYVLFLLVTLLSHPGIDFQTWHHIVTYPLVRIFTFLALVSLILHAYIGVWTIFTDYVKLYGLRFFLIALMALALLSYLAWGIQIIWS